MSPFPVTARAERCSKGRGVPIWCTKQLTQTMELQLSFYDTDEYFEIWLDCWSDTYLDTDDYELNQLICK